MATNDCIETAGSSSDSALIHHRRRQLISLDDLNETSPSAASSSSTTMFGTEDFTLNSNSSSLLTGDNPERICDDGNKQVESLNIMNKLNSISDINNNQLIDDLRICLFGAALFSGKSTSLLKPYPDKYFDTELGEIRSVELMKIYQNIPSSESILIQNNNNEIEDKLSESIQLLDWIVSYGAIEFRHIRSIDQIEPDQTQAKQILLENFLTQTESKSNVILLEFRQNRCPNKLEKFQKLKSQFGSFYAFHGSALENFHSILHNGLANSLNKRSLFGFGTYLSSKLCVAIQYSPFGLNPFRRSLKIFGSRLSCVALCEIIDHPDVQAKKNQQKDMPNTYYVVPNNDLIRIAYILVYSSLSSSSVLDSAKFNFQSSCPKSEEAFSQSPDAKKSDASVSNAQSIHPVPARAHRAVGRPYHEANSREANTSYSNLFLIVIIVCFIVIGLLMTRKSNNRKFEF